jgi:hypothetical protein
MAKLYKCEICHRAAMQTKHHTVCAKCDADIDRKFEAETVVANYLWGLKHKCRQCHSPLTVNRYFDCTTCSPECLRETACEFDVLEDNDITTYEVETSVKPKVDRTTGTKVCKGKNSCGLEKPKAEFYANHGLVDGLLPNCKECVKSTRRRKLLDVKEQVPLEMRSL